MVGFVVFFKWAFSKKSNVSFGLGPIASTLLVDHFTTRVFNHHSGYAKRFFLHFCTTTFLEACNSQLVEMQTLAPARNLVSFFCQNVELCLLFFKPQEFLPISSD